MKAARRSIAFASGVLLYSIGTGAAFKYASIGLPRHIYTALGGKNSLQFMLSEALVLMTLLFLLAVGWGYLTLRPERRRHRPYISWMMAGVGVAWAGWLVFGAFSFALKPRSYSAPLQTMLLSSGAAPLFGGLNILGILAGVWLAGKLAVRKQLSLPRTRSRRRKVVPPVDAASDAGPSTVGPHTVSPPLPH